MDGEERCMIQGRNCHVLSSGRPSLFCHPIPSAVVLPFITIGWPLLEAAHVKTARREGGALGTCLPVSGSEYFTDPD